MLVRLQGLGQGLVFYFLPYQGPGRKGQFTESRVITQLLSCLLLLEVKEEGQVCVSASPVDSLWITSQGIKTHAI